MKLRASLSSLSVLGGLCVCSTASPAAALRQSAAPADCDSDAPADGACVGIPGTLPSLSRNLYMYSVRRLILSRRRDSADSESAASLRKDSKSPRRYEPFCGTPCVFEGGEEEEEEGGVVAAAAAFFCSPWLHVARPEPFLKRASRPRSRALASTRPA